MGEYENGATGNFSLTKPWPKLVDAGIKSIPTLLPLSATINTVGIAMADDHHYTTTDAGRPEFSRRVIAKIKSMNWFPPSNINPIKVDRQQPHALITTSRQMPNRLVFDLARGMHYIQVPDASQRTFQLNGKQMVQTPGRLPKKADVSRGE